MEFEIDECNIKTIGKKDAPEFFRLIAENKSRLENYFAGTVAKTRTLEDTIAYCEKIEGLIEKKEYIPFLLFDKETKKAIGLIDFKNIDLNVPKAEMGAFIDSDYEGVGLVSRAGSKLIDEIVKALGLKKVYCRAASENQRSINAILRYGFELEGTLRRDYKTTSGKLVDLNYYGKLYD